MWETQIWYEAVNRSIEIQRESLRTKLGCIRFNSHLLCEFFYQQREAEFKKMVLEATAALRDDLDSTCFVNAILEVTAAFHNIIEALYAKQPVAIAIITRAAVLLHNDILSKVQTFWNSYNKGMSFSSIVSLGEALYYYDKTMLGWGVHDVNFNWKVPITQTYCARLNSKIVLTLGKILSSAMVDVKKEGGKVVSGLGQDVEQLLWQILALF